MEAWTSTAQLKAAPDTESVEGEGGRSVHQRKEVTGGEMFCHDHNSEKEELINC